MQYVRSGRTIKDRVTSISISLYITGITLGTVLSQISSQAVDVAYRTLGVGAFNLAIISILLSSLFAYSIVGATLSYIFIFTSGIIFGILSAVAISSNSLTQLLDTLPFLLFCAPVVIISATASVKSATALKAAMHASSIKSLYATNAKSFVRSAAASCVFLLLIIVFNIIFN